MSKGKIGEGHLAAMGRLGLKELRNAATPSKESVADQEVGLYGTATQGEIADARGGPGNGPDQEGRSSLADLRAQAKERTDPAQEQQQKRERGGREA